MLPLPLLLPLLSKSVMSGEVTGLYPRVLVLLHLVSMGFPFRCLMHEVTKTPAESLVLPLLAVGVVVEATTLMAGVAEV